MESADMRGLEPLGSKIPCRCKSCRRHFSIYGKNRKDLEKDFSQSNSSRDDSLNTNIGWSIYF